MTRVDSAQLQRLIMRTIFCARCIPFCIREIVLHNVNDVSCVVAIKHECFSSIAFCTPKVGRRNVNDVSSVATVKKIDTL